LTAIFLRKKAKQRKKHPRFSSTFHLPDGTSDGTADDTTDDTEDDTEDGRSTDIADGFSDDFQTAIQMTPRRILRLLDAGSPDGGCRFLHPTDDSSGSCAYRMMVAGWWSLPEGGSGHSEF